MKLKKLENKFVKNIVSLLKDGPNEFSKIMLTRGIRWIHDKEQFPLTVLSIETLEKTKLFETQLVTKSQRQKYNRYLKSIGFGDILMIEHMISVKKIIEGMFKLELNGSDEENIKTVREYLETNTDCIVKLKNTEKELHG